MFTERSFSVSINAEKKGSSVLLVCFCFPSPGCVFLSATGSQDQQLQDPLHQTTNVSKTGRLAVHTVGPDARFAAPPDSNTCTAHSLSHHRPPNSLLPALQRESFPQSCRHCQLSIFCSTILKSHRVGLKREETPVLPAAAGTPGEGGD